MVLTEEQSKLLESKRRIAGKAPTFDPKTMIWRSWKSQFQTWLQMMGISPLGEADQPPEFVEFTKLILASSMKGSGIERIRPFMPGSTAANAATSLTLYLNVLETVFQPPQESRSLKLEFKSCKQDIREDVSSYLSTKLALYDVAYPEGQQDFESLLTEVIGGLYSNVIKRRLRNADNVVDRHTLRTKLFELVAKEKEQYLAGYSESTSLDGLTAVAVPILRRGPVTTGPSIAGEEPMEVDAVREEVARVDHTPQPKNDVEKRTCFGCKKVGHLRRNCPNGDGGRKGGKPKKDVRCFHCGKKGHMIEQCRKRMADKAEAARNKKKVQALTDGQVGAGKEDSESDEEIDFLGHTRRVQLH